jgi:hypothetical protein
LSVITLRKPGRPDFRCDDKDGKQHAYCGNGGGCGRRIFRRAHGGSGARCLFIARGAHRDAIQKNGLKIESVHGDLHLPKPNVTDDPAKVGPVDIVLFAVKLWDTETAAASARPLLGPDSRLITFQNGVDSVERVSGVLGAERVVGGAAYIATTIASPGTIKHTSQFARIRFGRADRSPTTSSMPSSKQAKPPSSISTSLPTSKASSGEIHFPHGHGGLDRRLALVHWSDCSRSRTARILSRADGRGICGR